MRVPPSVVKTKTDEIAWQKAKARVTEEYGTEADLGKRFWKLTMTLYMDMRHAKKGLLVRLGLRKAQFMDPFPGRTGTGKLSKVELLAGLRQSLASEEEAVAVYELQAEACEDPLTANMLREIADEERVHIGEFQRMIERLTGDEEEKLTEGAAEVEDEGGKKRLKARVQKALPPDLAGLSTEDLRAIQTRSRAMLKQAREAENGLKPKRRLLVVKGAIKGYYRKNPVTGTMEFVGPHHREYSKAEQRRVDEAEAKPTATPIPDLDDRPEHGIGRLPQDAEGDIKEDLARLVADERERIARAKAMTPAGTTQGQKAKTGAKCANCGRPAAGWNPGAGQHLCAKHWDEY
jgi:rubrerythrin